MSTEAKFRAQLQRAVEKVRNDAQKYQVPGSAGDFYRGMESGASSVMVELRKIQQHDEAFETLPDDYETGDH